MSSSFGRLVRKTLLAVLLWLPCRGFCQDFSQAASQAFLIMRMAAKYHVSPRAPDLAFSEGCYDQLFERLDPTRLLFQQSDIQKLSPYRSRIAAGIEGRRTDFLELLAACYVTRLRQADSLVGLIARKPFDFGRAESWTRAEDTSYPVGLPGMREKLRRRLKLAVLNGVMAWRDSLGTGNAGHADQFPDSLAAQMQRRAVSMFKAELGRILDAPGGPRGYLAGSYCKAVASVYDPHTEFFPLAEKENFEGELGGRRFRFGFSIGETDNGSVVIRGLEPGSPAFKCGLLNKGDQFQTVQWEGQKPIDVSAAGAEELSAVLSESNQDRLTITVKKQDGTLRTVTLTKEAGDQDENSRVKSFLLSGKRTYGYIALPAFYSDWENTSGGGGCADDVARAILELTRENISGLILDLRYNGGGSMEEAVALAGLFIDAGPVAQLKIHGYPQPVTLKDIHRGTVYDGPLILLVNGYSASASELLAGCLADYHRALIVGSPTFGKATGQVILPLDTTLDVTTYTGDAQAADYLKMTTMRFYRVNGESAQFSGIVPDVALPEPPDAEQQREADLPFALKPDTIPANPYYRPGPPLPVAALRAAAGKDMDTLRYFRDLQSRLAAYDSLPVSAAMPLDWKDALAEAKRIPGAATADGAYTGTYRVVNNTYDQQDIKAGVLSADLNQLLIGYLERDPYLKVCDDLLDVMAK